MLQKETILRKLEKIMMAVTFAEANLREMALSFLDQKKKDIRKEKEQRVEKLRNREEMRL